MESRVGYCTNVHAGANLAQMRANLERFALAVRDQLASSGYCELGLWLSAASARQLLEQGDGDELRDWLDTERILPVTLNGFPHGDFHQAVVKYDVYRPTWWESDRVDYTCDLIEILDQLLPERQAGTISTLPLGWPDSGLAHDHIRLAAENLLHISRILAELFDKTGREICLCLEPEPGCILQRSTDVVQFFQDFLQPSASEQELRHLGVCHDVCHADVMYESQAEVLQAYRGAGIRVAKVQVSSNLRVNFGELVEPDRKLVFEQLEDFAEDRYLHQTVVQDTQTCTLRLVDDLPMALAGVTDPNDLREQWRIHFHVPIFLSEIGYLGTAQDAIVDCLREMTTAELDATDFEVETYAWNVLPADLQEPELAHGIAKEIVWFGDRLRERGAGRGE